MMGVLLLAGMALLVGLVVAAVGVRGRRVGEDVYCRRCGFNLRGLPASSTACPECGADTTRARATVIGQRRRRPGLIVTGLVLAVLGGVPTGIAVADLAADVPWLALKPFGWTLSDAVAAAGTPNEPNIDELRRRFGSGWLDPQQTRRLVAAALQVQGDRTQPWPQPWEDLLNDLLAAGALAPADLQTYLEQGVQTTLAIKPALRRGRSMVLDLDTRADRLTDDTRLYWSRRSEPIRVGASTLLERPTFVSDRGDYVSHSSFGSGYFMGMDVGAKLDETPDGPTRLTTAILYEYELVAPVQAGPLDVRVPIDLPVTVAGRDDRVDTFVADPEHRAAMQASVERARVETEGKSTEVWLRIDGPPVSMAMDVLVRAGGEEHRVGSLRVGALAATKWHKVERRRGWQPEPGAVVDVVLRPSQRAAESTLTLETYWDGEIVVPGVVVDAPYSPPFNMDRSVAEAIVAAIRVEDVQRTDRGSIGLTLRASDAPARVAYALVVRTGDAEQAFDSPNLRAGPGDNMGYVGSVELPDPDATTMDLLLVPDPEWERYSTDTTPPWGYALIVEDVPVPDDSGAAAGPYTPRVVWPDAPDTHDAPPSGGP